MVNDVNWLRGGPNTTTTVVVFLLLFEKQKKKGRGGARVELLCLSWHKNRCSLKKAIAIVPYTSRL